MRLKLLSAFVITLQVLSLSPAYAQQGQPAPAPPQGQPAQGGTPPGAEAPLGTAQGGDAGTQNFLTPFDYDARGRRDPFQPPTDEKPVEQGQMHGPFLPLQKFDLTQIKLSAIIWDVSHPKAMITDPDNKVYIVGPNTKIGKNNGYIAVIREGEIVVIETTEDNGRLMSATRILRLAPAPH